MRESPNTLAHAEPREAAVAWLARLEAQNASEAHWEAFGRWLADPNNKRALDALEAALAIIDDHPEAFKPAPRVFGVGQLRPMVFAALAVAAAAFAFVQLRPAPTQQYYYEAPVDEARQVTLPDGTDVSLNRGAAIGVLWTARARQIDLRRGEAAFHVMRNTGAPFAVAAGAVSISDLGTEFNVLRDRSALTVTVREGSVRVTDAGGAVDLSPGDQAKVENGRIASRRVDPEDAFAWRTGRLIYHDAPLSDVVADLNRYSATPISIGDRAATAQRFSGVLIIGRAEAMTARLEAFLPLRSEHNAGGIVIRSR